MEFLNCYEGFQKVYDDNLNNKELQEVWFQFMEKYEYVRRLCIDDYIKQGYDWRKVAFDRVFNYNFEFVSRMNSTSKVLENIVISMQNKLNDFFKLDRDDTVIIIYHGLGNAAGWVTAFKGRPAIYLGLEKIVELDWDNQSKLEDLISHEYGHLVHMELRGTLSPYFDFKRKMIFRMYTEGVATYCESIFNGREKSTPEWYNKCLQLESELKIEFMTRLNNETSNSEDFFGDWNPVLGINEAGYFLGLQIIKRLLRKMSIIEVMRLDYEYIENEFEDYIHDI
ncbi:MAG: hypothetical protein KJ847_02135 [Firmicutes bacterium]|nr:hypothetical protein [Bacillota bacterium]